VAFFPRLVAGSIERAANLLPQIAKPRRIKLEQVTTGFFLILWGYFKKVVVADNCALIVEQLFHPQQRLFCWPEKWKAQDSQCY
jgi:D-alanyl-lipoteichoic acid acyltransferase DltB (MBOAT superfamily)